MAGLRSAVSPYPENAGGISVSLVGAGERPGGLWRRGVVLRDPACGSLSGPPWVYLAARYAWAVNIGRTPGYPWLGGEALKRKPRSGVLPSVFSCLYQEYGADSCGIYGKALPGRQAGSTTSFSRNKRGELQGSVCCCIGCKPTRRRPVFACSEPSSATIADKPDTRS